MVFTTFVDSHMPISKPNSMLKNSNNTEVSSVLSHFRISSQNLVALCYCQAELLKFLNCHFVQNLL